MNRLLVICALVCFLLAGCAGEEQTLPQQEVEQAFNSAMEKFDVHDYEGYMEYVDFDCEMDSIQKSFVFKALSRHHDQMLHERGGVGVRNVVDIVLSSDTVSNVYYEIAFADSTKDVYSQKMVKINGTWKIRMRN